ncbi:MAG: glutamyl-tRNA reductase, partial [Opitutales bacterium]
TGEIGQDVARALRSRGLGRLVVTSRRVERAAALAAATEGDAISFEDWPAVLERVGVAIFATSAPGALLEVETLRGVMERRRGDPLFLIDLAVPRDIEAACGGLDSVFLYNLEDLTAIANENRRLRESEIEKCRLALAERAEHFWLRLRP